MGVLESLIQMLSQKKPEEKQPQAQVNKGATTRALSTRDEYLQYQMSQQELGQPALPYEQWIAIKTEEMNRKK